jgi:hypothetical protein
MLQNDADDRGPSGLTALREHGATRSAWERVPRGRGDGAAPVKLGSSGHGMTSSGATGEDYARLLENPAAIAELSPETARALLADTAAMIVQLSALQPMLLARLGDAARPPACGSGELLDVQGVADRLKVSADWVYRRAKRWSFARKMDGALRFDPAGLDRWLASRRRG